MSNIRWFSRLMLIGGIYWLCDINILYNLGYIGTLIYSTETGREQAELDSEQIGIRTSLTSGNATSTAEIAKLREDSTIRAHHDVIGWLSWELLRKACNYTSFLRCFSVSTIYLRNHPLQKSPKMAVGRVSQAWVSLQVGDFPSADFQPSEPRDQPKEPSKPM